MFCIFDHGPQTGAIRMTSGACSLMISMTMRRPLDVITLNPARIPTGVPTLNLARKDLENVDLSFTYTIPMRLFRDGCEVLDEHVLCHMRFCRFGSCFSRDT